MAVAVQKYIKNMAKSVTYTASDVLSTKFEYVKDFKNENQEVFKEVYSSVKDYRTTFARVKKTITNSKVMDAARVGYDSIMYSITTGDFYAKNKESEVIEKYGGNLFADLDIDDDDFDWDNEDLSTGDKVVATAIKKNSKIGTALTVEAIATTGKAQMDVSKENTMLLYTQNERLLNKLDGGFTNILGFLKQNGEQTAKVQNKMNENLNKFMTNVDNNVTKLTKQMDELLEMQRNMYNPSKKDEKKKIGYDDIIGRNGVINIKEYMKHVKKQGFNTLNDMSGGVLSTLFGDSIEGSNLLATFASSPFRSIMTTAVNKALGKKFDKAASELNATLEGLVPSIIAKLNAAGKKEDSGIMGFLGKIFGIKDKSKESINTSAYTKGAIPFDGITKRAITDVIPYYLRKMTSILTGEQEMVYDFSTGKWTGMRTVKSNHQKTVNSANIGTADALVRILESNMGGRRLSNSYQNKSDYDRMMNTIESFAAKLQATGDYGSLTDLSSSELELKKMLDRAMSLDNGAGKDRRVKEINGKKIDSGRGRSQISQLNKIIRQQKISQNDSIKNINEGNSILRIIEAEGLSGVDIKDYRGKSYVNKHGDFNQRSIQEMPMAQALVRAKDEYGITLYQYLRDMGASLRFIKANSIHLGNLGGKNNKKKKKDEKISQDILASSGETGINYKESKNEKYISEYYKNLEEEDAKKEKEKWEKDIQNAIEKARKNNKSYFLATTTDYKAEGDNVSLARLLDQAESATNAKVIDNYNKEQKKAEDEKWKRMASIVGEDRAKKLRETSDKFESGKSLNENMKKIKDEGFSSKLMMFTKYMGNKMDKPGDVMADTILKVDYWLQKLLYGNDLKEEDEKKGFFQHMKETVEKGFQGLKDVVSDAFGKVRDKITQSKAYQSIKKFFVGEKDDEGIYQGGLFGSFMGGMQRGLRKNAKDVKEYMKQQALAAKNKIKDSLDTTDDTETTTTSTNPPSLTRSQKNAIKRQQINDKLNAEAMNENSIIADTAREKISEIIEYNNRQSSINNEKYRGDAERENSKQAEIDRLTAKIQNQKIAIKASKDKIASIKKEIQKEKSKGNNKNEDVIDELEKELKNQEAVLESTKTNRKKNKEILSKIINSKTNIKYMAVGGVNRTGKPFQSVLSAGEYLNGQLVPSTGIYTVPKGGVVVNPANASTRAKQATNERRYLNNIRRNAEANDKLTPTSEVNNNEDVNKFAELMTNKDWKDLEDNKQRAEFLGSVASRGVIGGGLGLLVGGPLLGAAVGAASSLTKSTDAFSSLIFGSAVTENGKVQVDEKGNVIRQDDGLISKEIMKAVPDVKKFGLGGAIAGLITPLGPLGGILAGSALGFAKNSEIFQGSLFGEGGVLSDENIKKLKKGAKNMGIGAIIGAFTGPFGLVGNALLGATAGYVTSTDKFKDAILGEKIDPNDPDSKRQGGVLGAVKSELKPLKNFGRNLVDKIMDEIFGKKEGDKRQGGIFGAIKENMVEPIISGTKSVFQSLQNKVSDLAHLLGDTYKKFRMRTSGNGLMSGLIERADSISGGLIHGAGSVFKAATKPFRLIGDDGLGGRLKAGRIRKGQEVNMTARERLAFRGKHKMKADDNFSKSDNYMADASADDLAFIQALLNYNDNKDDVDSAKINSYTLLGQQLREDLSTSDSKKIIKMLKNDDAGGAERFVRTRKISDEAKKNILKNIGLQKSKLSQYDKAYSELKDNGGDVQKLLNGIGFNVDVKDPKAMRYLKKQLNRELAHKESGLTDEEIEFDKKREFWNNTLKPISMPLETMVNLLKNIYNEDKLNNEYNRLTIEFDRLVAEGNDTEAEKVLNKAIDVENKLNGVKSDIKAITDKHQEEQKALKNKAKTNKLQQASEMKEVPETVKRVIQDGLKIFDIKVMKLLINRNNIEIDIDKWKDENPDKEPKGTIILTSHIGFTKFNKTYEFDVNYKLNISSNEVDINGVKQPESFDNAREDFANEYVQAKLPKEETGIWAKIPSMALGDMVKNTIKISGFFVLASIVPGGAIALLLKFGMLKLNKKFQLAEKAKKLASRVTSRVKHNLGSHEIDMKSWSQNRKEKKYSVQASKALDEAIKNNDSKLNDIAQEKYGKDYSELTEEESRVVNLEFMNRFRDEKRSKQVTGHGLVGNVKALAGNIKSGVKNSVAGAINKVKEKKLKAQEQETFLGKLFNRLDKWKLRKEKQDVEGKKDSRLTKIVKWLFVGGIAAPIIVGFAKDKLIPAIHDRIQPWLKKAGRKLIGVKNQQTGEYEGGLVSGIVNPIKNFFKDKFQTISDWFHNTGKFSNENSGFKGLINNLKGVGIYMMDLWKSGTKTIINELVPKATESFIVNLVPLTGALLKGVVNGIKALLTKDNNYTGEQDVDNIGSNTLGGNSNNNSNQMSTTSKYGFNNTVGGIINVAPVASVNLGWSNTPIVSNSSANITKNKDGTETATNEFGESVTSQKFSDDEMMYYGTNSSQQNLYIRRDGSDTKTYVRNNDGTYSSYSDLQNVFDSKLYNNKGYDESIKNYDKSTKEANRDEVGYYNDDGLKSTAQRYAQLGILSILSKNKTRVNNLKGAGNLVDLFGKGMTKIGKGVSHIPFGGKLVGSIARADGAGLRGIGKATSAFGNVADVGNDLFNILGNHIDAKRGLDIADDADNIANRVSKSSDSLSGKFKNYFIERNNIRQGNRLSNKAESAALSYVAKNNIYRDTMEDAMSKGLSKSEAKKLAKEAEEKAIDQFKSKYSSAVKSGMSKRAAKKFAREALDETSDEIISETIEKGAKTVAGEAAEKSIKTAASEIMENATEKGIKTATGEAAEKGIKTAAKDVAEDVLTDGKSIRNLTKFLKAFPEKIVKALIDLFKNKGFKAVVGEKIIKKFTSSTGIKMLKTASKTFTEEMAKECVEKGAKKAGKAAFKSVVSAVNAVPFANIVSLAISAIMVVTDFITGWNDAGNILQISNDKLTFTDKLMASLIRGLESLLSSLPGFGTIFTGIFLLLNEQTLATIIIKAFNSLVNFVTGEDADIMKRRKESEDEWKQYNQDKNANLSFEQWNNREHATTWTKLKGNVSSLGWSVLGKDAQTKEDLAAADYKISVKSETVQNIKDKLADIIGYMWETRSDKIKKAKEVTRDQFVNTCTKVIDKIVILLNDVDDKKLEDVYDSACNISGPIDWKLHGYAAFDGGWYNAKSYLKLPEDTKVNNTIRCVGAIASVLVKSCGGAGLKWKIIPIVITEFGNLFRAVDDEQMKKIIDEQNENISDINNEYNSAANIDASVLLQNTPNQNANDVIATNANANNKLSPLNKKGINNTLRPNSITGTVSNTINNALSSITGGGFAGIGDIIESLRRKNMAINKSIDALKLLPTDNDYWKIEIDDSNPFASALFKFTESISRVIKAPFSLAASMNASTANLVTSGNSSISVNSGNNGSNENSGNDNNSGTKSSGGIISKISSVAKKMWSGIKSIFGKGKGDSDSSDPFHIYQRDFNQSFNISGDSEHQSVADSGCGPASAASILRMYGKEGSMNNAVNYALNNNYKEQNGGTYPSYFQDYLGKNGISTNPNASNADVINNLANNKPVILMGQNTTGSKNTPYGNKYSHYVVARGFDKNGNVIVEDSEDRRGNTRYSLADTLRNTSVRITTGNGKYGRGQNDMSINERYITNVNNAISATVSSIIASAMSGANISSNNSNLSSSPSYQNNINNSGNTSSTTSFSIDSEDTIICGDSITYGLSSTSLGKRALGLSSGTTDKNNSTNAGSYETIFKDNSDVISKAKNVIFFWGMNEVFTNQSTDAYFAQYQDSIDTILGYGGKSASNVNVCILPVIWVPENSGYGGMYTAAAVEAFNAKYIKPFAESKGYPLIDIYEDSKQVPHQAGDVHPSDYEKLYEIIKKHTSGGSGRGKSIINKNKKTKYGRSIWGRDGEEDTTPTTETTPTDSSTAESTSTNDTSESTNNSSSNTSSSKASGLISLLTDYSTRLTKGVFGNFYDALYGSQPESDPNNGNADLGSYTGNINGDAKAAIGKTFSVTMDGVTKSLTMDEGGAEIYTFLVDECGCNAASAAGALGNWVQECGGGTIENIKPVALKGMITDGGGLMQWTAYKGINPHSDTWINEHPEYASDPWSWEAQLAHVKDELTDDKYWSTNRLNKATDQMKSMGFKVVSGAADYKALTKPDEAAVNFERGLEGSADFWGGVASSEAYKNISYKKLYCFNRRLYAKIIYGLVTGEGSGSGRGKGIVNKAINNNYKIKNTGRGIWGRDGEDDTTSTTETTPTDSSTVETTDTTAETTSNTSSASNTGPKSLISRLSDYAKRGIKGVYGNFYNALYGNEQESQANDNDNNNNGISGSDTVNQGTGVPYETYKHWKQGDYGTYPAPWANKNIATGGGHDTCANSGCALVSSAILLVHSGAVMESDFDPGKFIDDVVSRGATDSRGCWSSLDTLMNYKNSNVMTGVDYQRNCFGSDFSGSSSWDTIYNTLLGELNNGNYVMIRVTIRGNGGHFVALDYIDTSSKEIYIMDPGSSTKEKLSDYGAGKVLGYATFKTSASSAKQYILNGKRTGSGRGNYNENTYSFKSGRGNNKYTRSNINSSINKRNAKKIMHMSIPEKIESPTGTGRGLYELTSYNDSISKSNTVTNTNGTTSSSLGFNSSGISNNSFTSNNNNNLNLNTLLSLVNTIANNSEQIATVITLLSTIASNTNQTDNKSTNNTNNNKGTKNGLSALRNALDSNSSGIDIAKAVYQIAQS